MSTELSTILSAILGAVGAGITAYFAFMQFMKRLPIERVAVQAEANQDNANAEVLEAQAQAMRLDNNSKMIEQIKKLQNDLVEVNGKYSDVTTRVVYVTNRLAVVERLYEDERELRIKTQEDLITERKHRQDMEDALEREKALRHKENSDWRDTVRQLEKRIEKQDQLIERLTHEVEILKKENGNGKLVNPLTAIPDGTAEASH